MTRWCYIILLRHPFFFEELPLITLGEAHRNHHTVRYVPVKEMTLSTGTGIEIKTPLPSNLNLKTRRKSSRPRRPASFRKTTSLIKQLINIFKEPYIFLAKPRRGASGSEVTIYYWDFGFPCLHHYILLLASTCWLVYPASRVCVLIRYL